MMTEARKRIALFAISLIAFVAFLDYTIVNTALPTLQMHFHVSVLSLQWIMNVYSLAVLATMVLFGRLGDVYGRRRVFYFGAVLLGLSSVGAGLADNFWFLIACRALQAIGVSAIVTLAANIIIVMYGKQAAKAMAVYGVVTAVGLAIGPSLGGFLIQHLNWRWVFLVNAPVIVVALCFCLPVLPKSKREEDINLDLGGAILLASTLTLLIFGLIHGEQFGWNLHSTWICLIIGLILIPVLLAYEQHQSEPIMNLKFFTNSHFAMGAMCTGLIGMVLTAIMFFEPLFLQRVQGYSPRSVGLILLATPIAIILFSSFVSHLAERFKVKRVLYVSYIIVALASLMHLWFSVNVSVYLVIVALFCIGISWTFCNILAPIAAQEAVTESQSGLAVGSVFTMFNIMAAISLAVCSVIFHVYSVASSHTDPRLAFMNGFHAVFWVLFIVSVLASIIGLFLLRKKD